MSTLNPGVLISVHGYAGDRGQIEILRPMYEHHQCPIVIISPENSQIHGIGPHICRVAGGVGYIGQVTWDRQYAQMKLLAEYDFPWYFMCDSDSFCITPKFPSYLYEDENIVYSNEVNDFRKPGQSWQGMPPWSLDYHRGYPLIAMQPSYWMSRKALLKIIATCSGLVACPTTPFIDWQLVVMTVTAGLKHKPYRTGASCETQTPNGKAVMTQCIAERGATFLHAIKTQEALDICIRARETYKRNHGVT